MLRLMVTYVLFQSFPINYICYQIICYICNVNDFQI